jgi:predicted transglutaminase-like cysteine proteinase
VFSLIVLGAAAVPDPPTAQSLLDEVEKAYGPPARARVGDWLALIEASRGRGEPEQLGRVNEFFNRLEFVEDSVHWGQDDYWATPVETLATNGGDCEDFAVAKYFTLRSLGVAEERLRLVYVKALRLDRAHMVLTYSPAPGAVPLVLDNLAPEIKPASERPDLEPVYSFNAEGLWLAKQRVGGSERVGRWRELLQRMGLLPGPPQ